MAQRPSQANRAAVRASAQQARPRTAAPGVRAQRIIATMAFTLIGVSAIAVVALLVMSAAGVPQKAFESGGLLVVQVLPLPGLTIGLLLVIALLVMGVVSRSRANRS